MCDYKNEKERKNERKKKRERERERMKWEREIPQKSQECKKDVETIHSIENGVH
jgi:hypothetical protein